MISEQSNQYFSQNINDIGYNQINFPQNFDALGNNQINSFHAALMTLETIKLIVFTKL
jgi:hypothetical protein